MPLLYACALSMGIVTTVHVSVRVAWGLIRRLGVINSLFLIALGMLPGSAAARAHTPAEALSADRCANEAWHDEDAG